jgi:hypothetical protein
MVIADPTNTTLLPTVVSTELDIIDARSNGYHNEAGTTKEE